MPTRPPSFSELRRAQSGRWLDDYVQDRRRTDDVTWRAIQSRRWVRLRGLKLSRNPVCERCEAEGRTVPAAQVHHVIPRRIRPDLIFSMRNLQSLCTACHAAESGKERTG